MSIWRMRTACRIPKATYTDSEYAILIVFFTAIIVVIGAWGSVVVTALRY